MRGLKHKLICTAAAVTAAAMLCYVPSFAASISITSAVTDKDVELSDTKEAAPEVRTTDLITIETESSPSSEVAILVTDADNSTDLASMTEADILYIDQETSEADASCSITFRLPLNTAAGTYAVYVSGTNVSTPAMKYLKVADSSGSSYMVGDVTGNSDVDLSDAMWIMRSLVGYDMDEDMKAMIATSGDVTGNGYVDLSDVMWVMRYLVNWELPDEIQIGEWK